MSIGRTRNGGRLIIPEPLKIYNDILPSDETLGARENRWTEFVEKYTNKCKNNEDALSIIDFNNLSDFGEDIPTTANDYDSSDKDPKELALVERAEENDDFDVDMLFNKVAEVKKLRMENWRRQGIEFKFGTREKVSNWLFTSHDITETRTTKTTTVHTEKIKTISITDNIEFNAFRGLKKHYRNYNYDSDDSLQSVDTAKYILSNKNKKASCSNFCHSSIKRYLTQNNIKLPIKLNRGRSNHHKKYNQSSTSFSDNVFAQIKPHCSRKRYQRPNKKRKSTRKYTDCSSSDCISSEEEDTARRRRRYSIKKPCDIKKSRQRIHDNYDSSSSSSNDENTRNARYRNSRKLPKASVRRNKNALNSSISSNTDSENAPTHFPKPQLVYNVKSNNSSTSKKNETSNDHAAPKSSVRRCSPRKRNIIQADTEFNGKKSKESNPKDVIIEAVASKSGTGSKNGQINNTVEITPNPVPQVVENEAAKISTTDINDLNINQKQLERSRKPVIKNNKNNSNPVLDILHATPVIVDPVEKIITTDINDLNIKQKQLGRSRKPVIKNDKHNSNPVLDILHATPVIVDPVEKIITTDKNDLNNNQRKLGKPRKPVKKNEKPTGEILNSTLLPKKIAKSRKKNNEIATKPTESPVISAATTTVTTIKPVCPPKAVPPEALPPKAVPPKALPPKVVPPIATVIETIILSSESEDDILSVLHSKSNSIVNSTTLEKSSRNQSFARSCNNLSAIKNDSNNASGQSWRNKTFTERKSKIIYKPRSLEQLKLENRPMEDGKVKITEKHLQNVLGQEETSRYLRQMNASKFNKLISPNSTYVYYYAVDPESDVDDPLEKIDYLARLQEIKKT